LDAFDDELAIPTTRLDGFEFACPMFRRSSEVSDSFIVEGYVGIGIFGEGRNLLTGKTV
jgi:hypothetical protein